MILKHKNNPEFVFNTSLGLRRFNNSKLELEDNLINELKLTLDYQNWLIEMEEIKISEVKEEKEVSQKTKRSK